MQLLSDRIRAGYAGIVLVTHEEARAQALLQSVCADIKFGLHHWSCTKGHVDVTNEWRISDESDPLAFLGGLFATAAGPAANTVIFMQDMHLFLKNPDPALYRTLKDALSIAKSRNICLVFCMPTLALPPDLQRSFSIIDFDLPGPGELAEVMRNLAVVDGKQVHELPAGDNLTAILDAAAGLTTAEAEDAFALSLVRHGCFDPATVLQEKAATIRKNGIAEYCEPRFTLDDVGGWDLYKQELLRSRHQFTPAAAAYHLEPTKGILLVGQGGTGKSLAAPITGRVFNIPVLRVNGANLRGSLYGQTEANWRAVMQTAKALKKCVLYIDEVDGVTGGAKSSGMTDGGTTASLVKAILQDVQDSTGIFFVFTANDIDNIPDPLIDRLDVWSVDLPNQKEREEIWSIHIRRRRRDPAHYDLAQLAKASDGFSGRQIERAWLAAMNRAFDDGGREPTAIDVTAVLAGMVPTSVTMKAEIEARRHRLARKARPVTTPTVENLTKSRRIAQ